MARDSLSIEEVEYVAHSLARKWMDWNEPIPEFSTRYPNSLESCIHQPFQKIGGKTLYPSMKSKGAILFYLMIKNHPFKNGNKRVAITTLLYFLSSHGKWLKIDNQELYNFARFVAESPPKSKDGMVTIVERFIEDYLADFSEVFPAGETNNG